MDSLELYSLFSARNDDQPWVFFLSSWTEVTFSGDLTDYLEIYPSRIACKTDVQKQSSGIRWQSICRIRVSEEYSSSYTKRSPSNPVK